MIVCTSCKTSYNVPSHFHWGLGQLSPGRGGSVETRGMGIVKKSESPDFRSPEVGISSIYSSNTFTRHAMADEKFSCQLCDKNAKQQRHNIQVNVTSFQV